MKKLDYFLIVGCIALLVVFGRSFGVLLVCGASLLFILGSKIDYKKHYIVKRLLVAGTVVIGLSFIIIEALILSDFGSDEGQSASPDYIVVLGSGLKGAELSATLKYRLDTSLKVAQNRQDIPILVSGGQGSDEEISEAAAMSRYLISKGISPERIQLENQSTSTEENLRFSKEIMKEKGIEKPSIILVTSDYHLFRAKLLARQLDITAYGVASPSPDYLKPVSMIREYLATIKSLVF